MYKSFKSFKENKEQQKFNESIDKLCITLYESGISFDEYWINQGLPSLISNTIETEDQLLEALTNPFSWDWNGLKNTVANSPSAKILGAAGRTIGGTALGAMKGAAQGFAGSKLAGGINNFFNPQQPQQGQQGNPNPQQPNPQGTQQPQQGNPNPQQPNPQGPQQGPQQGQPNPQGKPQAPVMTPDMQKRAQQSMDQIKKSLLNSMQTTINQFKGNRDSVGYQIANSVNEKLGKYLSQVRAKRLDGTFDAKSAFGNVQPTVGAPVNQNSVVS